MNQTLNFQKNLFVFGIPLLLIGTMVFISKTVWFSENPDQLALGITFDLLLTVPFVYFLLIRKTTIPKTTVVPLLIFGVIVCSFILPAENQQYLSLFKTWILPVVEIVVLSFVVYRLRKAVKSYRQKKGLSFDFFTTLKSTCSEILPKGAVIPVVTEIAVFYYGFIYWKKRELKENEFSYHKDNGTVTLLIAIVLIVAIETVAFHHLLEKWNSIAAWIFTALSIYSGIQVLGFLKSMFKRPISIENGKLFLRYGIMTEAIIDIKNIHTIEISSKDLELGKETRKLSFLGELESHNMVIRLKEKSTLVGLYGRKRTFMTLAFYVDDKIEFKKEIEQALEQ